MPGRQPSPSRPPRAPVDWNSRPVPHAPSKRTTTNERVGERLRTDEPGSLVTKEDSRERSVMRTQQQRTLLTAAGLGLGSLAVALAGFARVLAAAEPTTAPPLPAR